MRLLIALLLTSAVVQATKQPVVETDLLRIQKITEIKVTPDAAFAIYGVLSIHTEPAAAKESDPTYAYRTNLWLANLREISSKPVQLTFGDRADTSIEISPDGKQLAFYGRMRRRNHKFG